MITFFINKNSQALLRLAILVKSDFICDNLLTTRMSYLDNASLVF